MASFTDNTQALTNFNPYIQQLPVDAMVQVGVEKQKRYDEGIQKIQTNIENIAGLDVIRDVDKQYLNSKLNELGSKLKTVAAGDFSNYQLVNTVGGMTNQIAKDKNIQNAVYSASKYRKGLSDIELARKEGKSAPSNEWVFNTEANQWLTSSDASMKFNGGYQSYTNYKKNALDVIKSLTKDESITDDAFTFDRSGNLVLSDAIVRKKLSGISPEKIQQALLAGLTPSDFKQMEIDGRYNYSNVTPEGFVNKINEGYKSKADFYSKQRSELEAAKLQTQSAVEKNKLDAQIASLDKAVRNIKGEYDSITSSFANGDVESAKAKLETVNFMNNFSKAFSFTETSQTYENNPLAQMQMKREENAQDWKKFQLNYEQDERQFQQNFGLELQKLSVSKEANELKKKETEGYGGLPQSIKKEDVPQYTLARVKGDVENGVRQIEASDRDFINKWGKDEKWLQEQKAAYDKRAKNIDPLIAKHFNETEQLRRNVESNMVKIGTINKEAEQKFGDVYSLIPKNAPTLNYRSPSGSFNYSPRDIVDFNNTIKRYQEFKGSGSAGVGGGAGSVKFDDARASQELSPKELVLYNIYKKNNQGKPLSNAEKVLVENSKTYHKAVNVPGRQKINEINNYTAEQVTQRLTGSQGMSYEIPTGKAELRSSFGTLVTRMADFAESENGGLANSPDFDVKVARELAVDPALTGSITVVEGTSIAPAMYEVNLTGKDGATTKFKMTPEQKTAVFGNRFEASPQVQALRPYQEQIRKMGGYSTALTKGQSSHQNAFLNNIDFPSVSTYGVKANLVNSDGLYSVRLSVYDPISQKWHDDIPYPRTGLMNEDKVVGAIRNLNDSAIFEILNDRTPNDSDLKLLQQQSKKPF